MLAGMTSLKTFSDEVAKLVRRVAPAVVGISGRGGVLCSGVLWRESIVVTSEQALDQGETLTVRLDGGTETPAKLAGRDPTTNTAVLRIERAGTPASLGDAGAVAAGHLALAVGRHRTGHPISALGTVALAGDAWRSMAGGLIDRLIRLDLRPAREIEGAPAFDADGRLFGMVAAGPRRSVLVIPASTVTRAVDQLLAKGRITRGYFGVGVQATRVPGADRRRGLVVVSIAADGPAARAGLTVGDVLLNVDDKDVETRYDLLWLLGSDTVGRQVVAKGLRGGAPFEWRIEVGERPAA
jgi:S1-C subfamily serine protease